MHEARHITRNTVRWELIGLNHSSQDQAQYNSAISDLISVGYLQEEESILSLTRTGDAFAKHVIANETRDKLNPLREKFDAQLLITGRHLKRVDTCGDGSCLVRSICTAIGIDAEHHRRLRAMSCNLMMRKSSFFERRFNAEFQHLDVDDRQDFSEWQKRIRNRSITMAVDFSIFSRYNWL
eukprot:992422_1